MLYVNVFLVRQVWYSPAEGGCYYSAGTPLASIPVDSDYKPGKEYYLSEGVHLRDCQACCGTGKVAIEALDEHEPRQERCSDCGLIPEDLEGTWKLIQKYQKFFETVPGRGEDILVRLEENFAKPFPDRKPIYE